MKFAYLVQASSKSVNSLRVELVGKTFFILTWDEKIEGCEFFPNSSWSQGRNRLLDMAKAAGEFDYYIFMLILK